MNFDTIQSAWNSSKNRPTPDETAQLKNDLERRLRRRRRAEMAWLLWTFLLLIPGTFMAVRWMLLSNKFHFSSEWAALPMLGLPWVFALFFLKRFFTQNISTMAENQTIADTLRIALAENRSEQFKKKAVVCLLAAVVLALPVAMNQLHTQGKASTRELTSMAVFFGTALLLSGSGIAWKFFRRLRPEQHHLESLLASYEKN